MDTSLNKMVNRVILVLSFLPLEGSDVMSRVYFSRMQLDTLKIFGLYSKKYFSKIYVIFAKAGVQ